MKTCKDLAKLLPFDCCSACHTDSDEFDISLCETEFQGEEYYTCCAGVLAVQYQE